jgi:DNA segregation ATPase FtsK/SpoIIIE, S-DNA-T family
MAKDKKRKRKKDYGDYEEERKRWHEDLKPETKQSVWAVLSFVSAGLLLLSWLGQAGLAGKGISVFFSMLFGKTFLVVPLALFLAGISFLFGMRRRIFGGTFLGALLFLVSVLGLGETFGGTQTAGLVGYGIAFAPLTFFDKIASALLFSAFGIISILLMFNVALVFRKEEPENEELETEETEAVMSAEQQPKGFFARVFGWFRKNPADTFPNSSELQSMDMPSPPPEEPPHADEPPTEDDTEYETSPVEKPSQKPLVSRRIPSSYVPPSFDLLEHDRGKPSSGDVRAHANIIQRTLQNFGIDVDMGEISVGPSVTQYTLKPAEGVKLQRITNLASNLGLALAAHPLRIEAPIPGRSLVGIEVPNKSIAFVGLKSLLSQFVAIKKEYILGFALGRDVTGQAMYADLARMPHLLVAGSTGSGKSVTIHSLLLGLLYSNPPELLKLILIDPKRVELAYYNGIPHLMSPVVTEAKKAITALRWAVSQMDKRYQQLQAAGARDILSYNADNSNEDIMPYLVIVIDELADLMAMYPREVEGSIVRLAQMARAVGIHLVVSTQRPSVEVITGLIKANITTRLALQMASQIDSRTILDMAGAEKLLGKGDMLFLPGDATKPKRIQGVYVSEQEVKRVTKYLCSAAESVEQEIAGQEDIFAQAQHGGASLEGDSEDDELYEDARNLVLESGKASTSLLQRRLRLGYARAARLIDMLEDRGVVGPGEGAKPREILIARDAASIPDEQEEIGEREIKEI